LWLLSTFTSVFPISQAWASPPGGSSLWSSWLPLRTSSSVPTWSLTCCCLWEVCVCLSSGLPGTGSASPLSTSMTGTLNQMKAMKTFLTEATTLSLRRYLQYSKIFYRYRLSWWNKFWTEKYKIKLFIRVTGIKLTYNGKVFVETSTTDLVVYISRPPSAQCFISLVYANLSLTVNIILTTNP